MIESVIRLIGVREASVKENILPSVKSDYVN